jgi:hypothetical protein
VAGTDLALAAGATFLVALTGLLMLGNRRRQRVIVVRWLSLAVIGGMLAYLFYALHVLRPETWGILPDAAWVPRTAMIALVMLGALLPWAVVMATARE